MCIAFLFCWYSHFLFLGHFFLVGVLVSIFWAFLGSSLVDNGMDGMGWSG
jgi:hypothetical protein